MAKKIRTRKPFDEDYATKFRTSNNAFLLQSLFLEGTFLLGHEIYTLARNDRKKNGVTYPSLRRLYLETEDPTGYQFALKYLDGYEHFLRLKESSFFKPHLKEWEEELSVLLQSRAIAGILQTAREDSRDGQIARKYILDTLYKKPRTTKAGLIKSTQAQEDQDLSRLLGLDKKPASRKEIN